MDLNQRTVNKKKSKRKRVSQQARNKVGKKKVIQMIAHPLQNLNQNLDHRLKDVDQEVGGEIGEMIEEIEVMKGSDGGQGIKVQEIGIGVLEIEGDVQGIGESGDLIVKNVNKE